MYSAGYNIPGYLPTGEPQEFCNLESAQDYLIDVLTQILDEHPQDMEVEREISRIQAMDSESQCYESDEICGEVFWIYKTN